MTSVHARKPWYKYYRQQRYIYKVTSLSTDITAGAGFDLSWRHTTSVPEEMC